MDVPEIPALAQQAAAPEHREAGPGDVQPTAQGKFPGALVSLPMSEDEFKQWQKDATDAMERVKAREAVWDILLKEYLPVVKESGVPEALKVNAHFRNLHTKLGSMFYRSPDLFLTPDDPSPAQDMMPNPMPGPDGMPQPPLTMEDIISVKQAVLNKKLGRDGIKANRLMDELLFDVLGWSGVAYAKVGYRCVTKPIQEPVMQLAPAPQMGMMPGAPPAQPQQVPVTDPNTGQPMTRTVQVPIHEEWYARRFSPKKGLTNKDLRSTRLDEDATWVGMRFYMSPKKAMAAFTLTEDDVAKATSDDRVYQYEEDKQAMSSGLVAGTEIWCKASYFTDELHPLAVNQLVLIDGMEKPAVWRPSPDQTIDPTTGQLSKDSLIGFPILMLSIRDLADSSFPPSDAAFTNATVKELNTYRRQGVQLRDAVIGKYLYDTDQFDSEDLPKLKSSQAGDQIPVKPGALREGVDKIYASTTQITRTQDDYRGQDILKRDMDETLGIGANQAGVESETVRTATETAAVSSGANARNEKERARVVDFYLDLARKLDQLLMRYADVQQYIEITGQDGARRMQMWNKAMISGKFLYEIAPDSQMAPDNAVDFKSLLQFYNLAAQDPLFNRGYVLRRLARMKGLDPSKVVLNPLQAQMQTPHGGGEVNQHMASNSGKRPNEPGAENHRAEQPK